MWIGREPSKLPVTLGSQETPREDGQAVTPFLICRCTYRLMPSAHELRSLSFQQIVHGGRNEGMLIKTAPVDRPRTCGHDELAAGEVAEIALDRLFNLLPGTAPWYLIEAIKHDKPMTRAQQIADPIGVWSISKVLPQQTRQLAWRWQVRMFTEPD